MNSLRVKESSSRSVKRKVRSSNSNSNSNSNPKNPSNNINISNNNSENNPSKSRKDGPTKVDAFDPELLDCPICFAPFTIPIFQCENGHTACSSCCQNLAKKCPSCALPIGSIRCRAIENVLESVKLRCRNWGYGCTKSLNYGDSYLEHEKTCVSAPCTCPIPGCSATRSSTSLYFHFTNSHGDCMISFEYDHTFTVSFTNDDKFLVLGVGGNSRSIFLLNNNKVEQFGNVITVIRIAPASSKESYYYDLEAKIEGTSHTFRSYAKNIPSKFEGKGAPSIGFLLDHVCAASDNGKISMDICIWNQGSRPAAIPSSAKVT